MQTAGASSKKGRISFRRKLLRSIFGMAIPVIAVICAASFFILSSSYQETVEEMQSTDLAKISGDLSYIIENTENLSRDMIFNNEIQQLLAESAAGEQYPENSDAAYYINGFIANRDFISSVILTGTDQTLYSTEKAVTSLSDFYEIRQSQWFQQLQESDEPYEWFVCTYEGTEDAQDLPALMLARPIYSLDDYVTLMGYLMIYLDDDYLREVLDGYQFGETTNLWLTEADGTVILSNPAAEDDSSVLKDLVFPVSSRLVYSQGQRFAVRSESLPENGWYLSICTPYREINTGMVIYRVQLMLIILSIMILLIFLALRTASSISRPIIRLSGVMDAYGSGDGELPELPESEDAQETDEIRRINQSYRQMIDRLQTLIQENYIKTIEKKDAELALLQSQINPHFLYNTLDSINWMALANDQDEISEMITALSDMFRLSLTKSSSSYIRLEQELEYVQSYLVLMKFRHGESLQVSWRTEENIGNLYIPRFVLQPLVENALKYGTIPGKENFQLDIRICLETSFLCLYVINDGDTIDLAVMDQLLDFDPDKKELLNFSQSGYGVQNIHRRIRILCGKEYGLQYEKKDGRTCCEVRLPIRTRDV